MVCVAVGANYQRIKPAGYQFGDFFIGGFSEVDLDEGVWSFCLIDHFTKAHNGPRVHVTESLMRARVHKEFARKETVILFFLGDEDAFFQMHVILKAFA